MVLAFLFGRKKSDERKNELEEIKNRVLVTENSLQQLSSYVQSEVTKIYSYLHQMHTDIDGIASVLDELKKTSSNTQNNAIQILEQRVESLERIADNISLVGRVALRNHERIGVLESRINEMLLAIDRLVDELLKSSAPSYKDGKKKEREVARTPEEPKTEKKGVKRVKGSMSKEREYLAELSRLRKELLEMKAHS